MKVYLYGKGVYLFDEIFIWPLKKEAYILCGGKKESTRVRTISQHADRESADRALNDIYEFLKSNPDGIY